MPSEPLPWDRRDFRKHERSGSDSRLGGGGFGGSGGPYRWREQQHHPHTPPPHSTPYHQHQQRWYSDFRSSRAIPPGHGKQGGWHMYEDEVGHGFLPFGSRYSDRNSDSESCRPLGSRGDGRYLRYSRENGKEDFCRKDWKAPSREPSASQGGPERPTTEANQRSAEKTLTCLNNNISMNSEPRPPLPVSVDLVDQSQSLPKNEKREGTTDGMVSTDQKIEKENGVGSIDWKPLKWSRSGSFCSRGSGFSHSNSPKSMGVDSVETVTKVQMKNSTTVQSPTETAAGSMPAALSPLDEASSRKKPRLGWGEGLAKYEKKKVEGPEDGAMKVEVAISDSNVDALQFHAVNPLDKCPGVASLLDGASPATPSSVACSSSPGIEEKDSVKGANTDCDRTNLSCSPSSASQNPYDGPILNLENLELSTICNLSTLINELLQSDEPSSLGTGYLRNSSMNKLLLWKADILKALEVTETEIDSLETEFKSLIAEPMSFCSCPASSSSLPKECGSKPDVEQAISSNFTIRPAPLQVVSSGRLVVENKPATLEDEQLQLKDEGFDSPGSATSKFTEVLPTGEDVFLSEAIERVAGSLNFNVKDDLDEQRLESVVNVEENANYADDHELILEYSDSNIYYDCRHVYYSILASNEDTLNTAVEELSKLLPGVQRVHDSSAVSEISSLHTDSSLVAKRFRKRKRFLQFKEKVLTLKYRAFQHFWNESRVLSVRKLRMKSHKKFHLGQAIYKKNRSSSRSKISTYAGSPQTVAADEVIEFINALLSERTVKPCRSTLKMPALILDKSMKMSRFISTNGLVHDPCAAEKERALINPWTFEEREIFIDKLAAFGKDFKKIASFLDRKTIADCVEFYYKNHKSDCFERARKKTEFMKQSKSMTYLVTTGKRSNREANATSLDILGAASAIAANVDNRVGIQQKSDSGLFFGESNLYTAAKADDCPLQRTKSLDMHSNERETIAADVLAGIGGSLSSEAMSSCITSSVDPGDAYQDWRCQKIGSSTKRPLTPEVVQNIDGECSDESCGEMDPSVWTDEEKSIFIQAVSSYGKDFGMISQRLGTRSREQCKIFFSKARKCLGLDGIQPVSGSAGSGDVNGGSDFEDACVIEPGSLVCNEVSDSKMDEDFRSSDVKLSHQCDISGTQSLSPDFKVFEENDKQILDHKAAEVASMNPLVDDTQLDDEPVTEDLKDQDGAVVCNSVQDIGVVAVSSTAESMLVREERSSPPSGSCENNALTGASYGDHGEEIDRKGLLADNLEKVENRDANSSEASGISFGVNDRKSEFQLAGNDSHPSADVHSSTQVHNLSACEEKPDLEKSAAEKSNVTPVQENGPLLSMESSTLFPVPIKFQQDPPCDVLSAVVSCHWNSEKHTPKIVQNGDCQLQSSGYASDDVDSSQILRGYPVAVQSMKEINGDVTCENLLSFQHAPMRDGILHSDRRMEFSLQKCNSSRQQRQSVDASFPIQEQIREPITPQSCLPHDADKSSGNGDVKLFGKILKSSQQKSNPPAQRDDANNGQRHKGGVQSLHLNFGADHKVNLVSAQSMFDCYNYLPSENIPVIRSFGFWDGNRMQTGFPPLPDSTLLLTKYPAAISGNYTIPTVKLQQPLTHGAVKNRDNGVSVFPSSREMNTSNGVADYQILRNQEVQQPYTMDVKQPHDLSFSEMQRRNGFDVSRMQQNVRGMVGVNVVGRDGVLVGGQCSGISDPVAAIRMHYAKAEQFSLHARNAIKEDDAWRSNREVGR